MSPIAYFTGARGIVLNHNIITRGEARVLAWGLIPGFMYNNACATRSRMGQLLIQQTVSLFKNVDYNLKKLFFLFFQSSLQPPIYLYVIIIIIA